MLSAVVARKMPTEEMKVLAFGILFDHGPRAHGKAGADLDVFQFVFAGGQRLVENIGLAERGAVVYPHAGFDEAGSLFRGDRLAGHRWLLSKRDTSFRGESITKSELR